MTAIKASSHGIVVDHVESGVRYAISDKNYNVKFHRKVRELEPGETVLGFTPLRKGSLGATGGTVSAPSAASELTDDQPDSPDDHQPTSKTTK